MDEDDFADEESDSEDHGSFAPPTHVFYENEPLIRALNDPRRGENDPELATRLFGAILDSTLITLIPEEQPLGESDGGEVTLDGDLELSFILVRHPDVNGDIVPMFTDEGSLGAFIPNGGRYVALAVRDLFPLLGTGSGSIPNIVVNPGGDEALLLTPRMVQDLIDAARGYGTRVIGDDTEIEVEPIKEPMPDDAKRAVITLLKSHSGVISCTEIQWFMPDRHEYPSLVLVMELDPLLQDEERRFALASLWRDLSPVLRTLDRQVEMVDLDGQKGRLSSIIDQVEPFYMRDSDNV